MLEQYVLRLFEQLEQQQQPCYGGIFYSLAACWHRLETAYREAGDDKNLCRIALFQSRVRG